MMKLGQYMIMLLKACLVSPNRKKFAIIGGVIGTLVCITHIGIYPKIIEAQLFEAEAEFIRHYVHLCQQKTPSQGGPMKWCDCIPDTLVGQYDVAAYVANYIPPKPDTSMWRYLDFTALSSATTGVASKKTKASSTPMSLTVEVGGHWRPSICKARQSVAIIIPYRNRQQHLEVFEKYIHAFLQRQQLDYSIFVIEQGSPAIFNRAALMNVGYLEAFKQRPGGYDCFIFHDVDLLPENDKNMYTCYMSPVHLGAYMNKFKYRMPYSTFFGGAIAIDNKSVASINGFPTRFYGWGGEDDEIWNRVKWQNLTIQRYPPHIGRSFMVNHDPDEGNPVNPRRDDGYTNEESLFAKEGLSSVKYKVVGAEQRALYTKITINLEKEYKDECIVDHKQSVTTPGNYVECMNKESFESGTIDCCRRNNLVYCCNAKTMSPKTTSFIGLSLLLLAVLLIVVVRYRREAVHSYFKRLDRTEKS